MNAFGTGLSTWTAPPRWAAIGVLSLLLLPLTRGGDDAAADASDEIFGGTNILQISIEIPRTGMQSLAGSTSGRRVEEKPEAMAQVKDGGRVYTNVAVQLKGYTTFRQIDSLPSLTLDFNKHAPKQTFHGLTKLSLNNSLQDPTRLHEKLSRELFTAAGVPTPRADYALVTLNGRTLGLYVLTEGFDKRFLKRHFQRADGALYEGAILRDIDQSLQIKSGQSTNIYSAVRELIDATREQDDRKRLRALGTVLDLDRFLSMIAMETILCHSDSYSMNRNNYRLYRDPTSEKFVFMPHGMDRVLGGHRSPLDLAVVPPALGMVARAVLSTEEGRSRYVARAGTLFTNFFQPEALCRRVREMDARILVFKTNETYRAQFDSRMSGKAENDAEDLCHRIAARAAHVQLQFHYPEEFLAAPALLDFSSNAVALADGWQVRPRVGETNISCSRATREGQPMWHVRAAAADSTGTVTLSRRMTLPAGIYRLTGSVLCLDATGQTNAVTTSLFYHASSRYAVEQRRFDARRINLGFQIVPPRLSDEVELRCEIRTGSPEFWFDPGSLRLRREDNFADRTSPPARP